jgi:hypothetical protein
MNFLLVLAALAVLSLLAMAVWRPRARHEAVEYFGGWGGYRHPIGLQNRISKAQADALDAHGAVYMTGYFDGDSRLTRVVKMYRGEMFFDYRYEYDANGRLKSASVERGGRTDVLEFDARGREVSGAGAAF